MIAVLIPTRNRPEGLRRCLDSVLDQAGGLDEELRVIIVENGMAATAERDLALQLSRAEGLGVPVHILLEPRPGVAHVRNRAVEVALQQGADRLAFLDDDEVAHAGWLAGLVAASLEHRAPIVAGPVRSVAPPAADGELLEAGLFGRTSPPTGTQLRRCATGNVLVDAQVFRSVTPWFDERLGSTGGEDTEFFGRARAAGHTIVWSREGVVDEHVEIDRYNIQYVIRRAYQSGLGRGAAGRINASPLGLARLLGLGSWQVVSGSVRAIGALPRGRLAVLRELRQALSGLGILSGLLGHRVGMYGRPGA